MNTTETPQKYVEEIKQAIEKIENEAKRFEENDSYLDQVALRHLRNALDQIYREFKQY